MSIKSNEVRLKPIYAHGFFHVCRIGGIYQTIMFRYVDETSYYWRLLRESGKGKESIEEEISLLRENMQSFLDDEEVYINDKRTRPVVSDVVIDSVSPGEATITFLIRFRAPLRSGVNTYVNIYEEEIAEYDYTVVWLFPVGGRVVEARVGVDYEVRRDGSILLFRVKKGTRVGGREEIVFEVY